MGEIGEIIVFTGPPGAGKTTAAGAFLDGRPSGVHISADVFHSFLRGGRVEPHSTDAADQDRTIVTSTFASARAFADGGYTVAVDGLFPPDHMDSVLAAVPVTTRLHWVILTADPGALMARSFAEKSKHTLDTIVDLHGRFEADPSMHGHVVDTTSLPPTECQAVINELFVANDLLVQKDG